MYNKNYYPTPNEVIKTMLAPHMAEIKTANILEPSAGMGAIADYLCWNGAKKPKVWCCEIDPQMKATLQGKGYKVVCDDFFSYSGALNFDLIVMNPPFDRGADHLLKAWDIMRDGHVICLLNAETINNPHTEARRTLAALIERHGSVEMLGDVFAQAARKTGVEVALVRLYKQAEESSVHFNMKATAGVDEIDLSSTTAGVERMDYISALIRSYQESVKTTAALFEAMKNFQLFTGVFVDKHAAAKLCGAFFETAQKEGYSEAHNEFVLAFQRHAWNMIFNKTRAGNMMTAKTREKFNKWREEMGGADLNEENIAMLFDALIQNRSNIADECIVEAFDKLTYYAESNRASLGERWKTNSAYMVAEKFILPNVLDMGYGGGLSLSYGRFGRELLDDIDRAMCMVSGKLFEEILQASRVISAWCNDHFAPLESEFFTIQCYQKGSAHFRFKDEGLRHEFNRRACAKKGWQLPETETFRGKARRSQKA